MDMADRQRVGPAVLVVHASSVACAEAVAAFVAGRADVVLGANELDLLPEAVAAASRGFSVLSTTVVERARRVLPLSAGDRRLVALVADGASNEAIAGELGCSPASVKREVVRLARVLGVAGRAGLIETARELGF